MKCGIVWCLLSHHPSPFGPTYLMSQSSAIEAKEAAHALETRASVSEQRARLAEQVWAAEGGRGGSLCACISLVLSCIPCALTHIFTLWPGSVP